MSDNENIKEVLHFDNIEHAQILFGAQNNHLDLVEEELAVELSNRGSQLEIEGERVNVDLAISIFENLLTLLQNNILIDRQDLVSAIQMAKDGNIDYFLRVYQKEVVNDYNGVPIRTKNMGQYRYVKAMQENDIVFGIGPAGTGKTFLAVAFAAAEMKKGAVKRIVVTRPAVEAGENLGFLPGDLQEKVDPYLRPIYDALHAIFGRAQTERLMERGIIEVAPLAYMRGRTLDDAFVILDEAQNTTQAQMKMFLTRLGFGSKMVVNGDISQIDLGPRISSGLVEANEVLKDVSGIAKVQFKASDVVRHPLVSKIITAYDTFDKTRKAK